MPRFATVGERLERELSLSPEEIARFASASGDENPLHHDEAHARGTRFGGLIASGTQVVALLMGLTATHFSRKGAALGLEFSFRLRKAVRADDPLRLRWRVVRVEESAKLGGELAFLEGELEDGAGALAVTATATVLVRERL